MSAREVVRDGLSERQRAHVERALARKRNAREQMIAAMRANTAAEAMYADTLAILADADPDDLTYDPETGTIYRSVSE